MGVCLASKPQLIARTSKNKKATRPGSLELLKKDSELLELLTSPESSKFLLKKKKESSGRTKCKNYNFKNNYISILCFFLKVIPVFTILLCYLSQNTYYPFG